MGFNSKVNRAWAEINLDNLAHNVNEIKKLMHGNKQIMGVVKADAYGHGAIQVSKTLINNGVGHLAVAVIDEGIHLRKNGIDLPILVFSFTDPYRVVEALDYDLTLAVFDKEIAELISTEASRLKKNVKVHLKVDTGMTRIGFISDKNIKNDLKYVSQLPGITVEGIFTHLACADEDEKGFTYKQYERFMDICDSLEKVGVNIPMKHISNSAGVINFPEMCLDIVRPGIALYGLYPSYETYRNKIDLKQVMELKSNIAQVKTVKGGIPVSYGGTYITKSVTKIATVSIGYADGYPRILSNKGQILVNGEKAPIIGRICMDQLMVDVSGISSNINIGDEAVLFGRQQDNEIRVDDIAAIAQTINYEIVCKIGIRVPRVYISNNRVVDILKYIDCI